MGKLKKRIFGITISKLFENNYGNFTINTLIHMQMAQKFTGELCSIRFPDRFSSSLMLQFAFLCKITSMRLSLLICSLENQHVYLFHDV